MNEKVQSDSMNLRKFAFHALDFFRGSKIRKDFAEIKYFVETNNDNSSQLSRLLRQCTQNVPAYKNFSEYRSLFDFPVVNKMILRENLNDHISSQYNLNELKSTTTSGSTGTPFKIYFDERKIRRHTAALMYWNSKAGADLGNRLFYLRVWNKLNMKSDFRQFLENIYPIEVANFEKEEVDSLMERINKSKAKSAILGFASAITTLLHSSIIPNNISGIIAMSEHLSETVRLKLQEKFKCSVYARYSNMENGFIAQQYDNSGEYLINRADYIVEVLRLNEDKPAEPGEIGRLVVTDLYNFAMPFVRYDTGDLGEIAVKEDGRKVIKQIVGRRSDMILSSDGKLLSSHSITNSLWDFPEIVQFQFIQKDKAKYLMKLNMGNHKDSFARENELDGILKQYLGEDAQITFEYVHEIPVLNSGKRRYIINEYNKF